MVALCIKGEWRRLDRCGFGVVRELSRIYTRPDQACIHDCMHNWPLVEYEMYVGAKSASSLNNRSHVLRNPYKSGLAEHFQDIYSRIDQIQRNIPNPNSPSFENQ